MACCRAAAAQEPAPVPPVTDEDRRAAFPDVDGHTVHDGVMHYQVLFDQLEWQYIHGAQGLRWDTTNWVGGDVNRLWVKSEGEALDGIVEEAEVKVLYGRAILAMVGCGRRCSPGHPSESVAHVVCRRRPRAGAALVRDRRESVSSGQRAIPRRASRPSTEVLVTNRLVLQPLVELSLSGKDDPDRGIGAGLSTGEVGFRLRYEIRREIAPYVGVVWHQKVFGTADYARAAGQDVGGWHVVAGLRTWF